MGTSDFKDWSAGWIKDGQNISYRREGIQYFEKIVRRELLHWEYPWHENIVHGTQSGPEVPEILEITKGYNKKSHINHIWQVIFGIKGQVYVYVELPTNIHRHGLPKQAKPGTTNRAVSHFEDWMSPYHEPTFLTEHFMMRPITERINLTAWNPEEDYVRGGMRSVILNFFINSMATERIGTAYYDDELGLVLEPERKIMKQTLDKMYTHQIPVRPITLTGVPMPAAAPRGE